MWLWRQIFMPCGKNMVSPLFQWTTISRDMSLGSKFFYYGHKRRKNILEVAGVISHRCQYSLSRLYPSIFRSFRIYPGIFSKIWEQDILNKNFKIQKEGMLRFVLGQFLHSHLHHLIHNKPRDIWAFHSFTEVSFALWVSGCCLPSLRTEMVNSSSTKCSLLHSRVPLSKRNKAAHTTPRFTLDLCISYNLFTF